MLDGFRDLAETNVQVKLLLLQIGALLPVQLYHLLNEVKIVPGNLKVIYLNYLATKRYILNAAYTTLLLKGATLGRDWDLNQAIQNFGIDFDDGTNSSRKFLQYPPESAVPALS